MSLAQLLTQHRKEKGYTKSEVAKMVGVSEPTISRLESGKIKSIKSSKLNAFSVILGIAIEKLL